MNAPDFENPTDQDANNLYEVTVRASDGSLYDDQVISVSVTDVFENTSPSNLAAGSLSITENQAVGTVVGEFTATDPEGGAISYHLVSGIGMETIPLFTLDANGTLKTAVLFDYESNASSYSIRVQAKDEYNATVEGNFTAVLTDVYEPTQPNHFVDLNSTVNLEMIWVEPGTFNMGQVGVSEPEHNVTLTKGFLLGQIRGDTSSVRGSNGR